MALHGTLKQFGTQLLGNTLTTGINKALGLNQPRQLTTQFGVNRLQPTGFNINSLLQGTSNLFTGQSSFSPLLGAGLLAAGASQKEPGSVTEARQFQRNLFAGPGTGAAQQVGTNVAGLEQFFQPLIDKQFGRGLEDISQRFSAAFPGTVGAQGGEFGQFGRFLTDEFAPNVQAELGNLGIRLLGTQQTSAQNLLREGVDTRFADALGGLGGRLLLGSGQQGQFPTIGQPGARQVGQPGQGILAGGVAGITNAVQQLLGTTSPLDVFDIGNGSFGIRNSVGDVIAFIAPDGTVRSQVNGEVIGNVGKGGAGTDFGLPGPGLLGPSGLGSQTQIVSSLGSGASGFAVGNSIGQRFEGGAGTSATKAKGALSGAAGGAAAGFAVGGPVGAVIGAIAGAIGGALGSGSAESERKQASIDRETQFTEAQRPAALQSAADLFKASNEFGELINNQRPQLTSSINNLLQSNDPVMQSIISEMRQIEQKFPSRETKLRDLEATGQAKEILRWFESFGRQGSAFSPEEAAKFPEGTAGLLLSKEVGKFGPGFEALQGNIGRQVESQALFNKLVNRLNQGGF